MDFLSFPTTRVCMLVVFLQIFVCCVTQLRESATFVEFFFLPHLNNLRIYFFFPPPLP